MASPYILDDEEADFYDEWGPEDFDEPDFWPIQIPPEIAQQPGYDPGYVRAGGQRPSYYWEEQLPKPAMPSFSNLPPSYVQTPSEDPMEGPKFFWEDEYEYTPRGRTPAEEVRATQMTIPENPFRALIPFSEMAMSPEEMEGFAETIFSPLLSQEDREALQLPSNAPPDPFFQASSGLQRSLLEGAEGLTSLPNLGMMAGTIALGGAPVLPRLASLGFSFDIGSHVPELARKLGEAEASGDRAAIWKARGDLAQAVTLSTMTGAHGLSSRLSVPEQIALRERARDYALQERRAATADGGLPEQPRPDETLPAQEGRGGVSPGDLPPGDQGRALPAEAPGGREVSLEKFSTAEATKPEVAKLATSRFNNKQGDPLGTTYHATEADWARWKEVQAELNKALEAKDTDRFQEVLGENERIKNKYGGMPPEPPKVAEAGKVAESAPLDFQKISAVDKEGYRVADPEVLRKQLESGELAGGEAGGTLLKYLLTPSEAHPLKAIRVIDLKPEDLQAITGHPVSYRGRFLLERDSPAAIVEILTRDADGKPITHAEFVKTLNHELTHNAVTSKFDNAPPEVKAALETLLNEARTRAKGTEMATHNALTDVHEFLAEIKSAKEVQDWMVRQKYEGKGKAKNFWGRFVDIVKDILGSPKEVTATMLDEAMRISGELEPIQRRAKQVTTERFGEERFSRVPAVHDAWEGVKDTFREALKISPASDLRRSVLNWSAKQQRSFNEASKIQERIERGVPDKVKREGITNWIQANGDRALLANRASATTDPKLRAGYEAAMNLTPKELAIAGDIRTKYAELLNRGQVNDVITNARENYVTQMWDLGKTPATASGSLALKERFKFNKARTFDSFFDGEQAGFVPKTKDISKLMPMYSHEMNSVIAARQLVRQMQKGVASDGRPLLAPRGIGVSTPDVTLVMPKVPKGETLDYRVLPDQPALSGWRWQAKDAAGNPVFAKVDLALHPEAFNHMKAVLGRSAIKEWYQTPTTRTAAIPKAIARGLEYASGATKRTMLGLFSVFHQIQEGTHAVGHRINPFWVPDKIDLKNNPAQFDAAKHGLMLAPDRTSAEQFMEGFRTSGLVSKIPGIGPLSDRYGKYLFHQYIPGLKFKTYRAMVERNTKVYAKDQANKTISPTDIKILSAEQANAAYGHLNYADLGRNPTIQHILQVALLAPDFLEARGRFAGQALKGIAGGKRGREQLLALATLAVAQAGTTYTLAKLSGGEWDEKDPFVFSVGSRKYTMRSVPEDISALLHNPRSFIYSRVSPLTKAGVQYGTGIDYAGRRVTAGETTKETLTQPIPLTLRSLPGVREYSGADRPGSVKWWEQLAGAMGVKISRANPDQKIADLHRDWMKNNPDPFIRQDYERNQKAVYAISKYRDLDAALDDKDPRRIAKAIGELQGQVRSDALILKRMMPVIGSGRSLQYKPLFHESAEVEQKFLQSLTEGQREKYDKAIERRLENFHRFLDAFGERGERPEMPEEEEATTGVVP